MHVQPLKPGTLQQDRWQIPKTGAVDMQLRLIDRQAGRLHTGLKDTIMAAGELNAANAQRRTQPLGQLGLDRCAVLQHQPSVQRRPAALYHLSIVFKAFAHAASLSYRQKNSVQGKPLNAFFVWASSDQR